MARDDAALDGLTALRDGGLCTDRGWLNMAFIWLARDKPTTGPCARCTQPTTRYGEAGRPLCLGCQTGIPIPTNRKETRQ